MFTLFLSLMLTPSPSTTIPCTQDPVPASSGNSRAHGSSAQEPGPGLAGTMCPQQPTHPGPAAGFLLVLLPEASRATHAGSQEGWVCAGLSHSPTRPEARFSVLSQLQLQPSPCPPFQAAKEPASVESGEQFEALGRETWVSEMQPACFMSAWLHGARLCLSPHVGVLKWFLILTVYADSDKHCFQTSC